MGRRNMRVLHVSPYVGQNPKFGGISRFVMALSAAQSDLGAEVTVASAADPAELAARNPVGSVRRVLLPTRFRRVGDWTNLRITPVLIRKLPELVKGFDVVHVHGLRTFQSAVFSILWRAGSQAMVLQPHGTASLMTGKRIQKLLFDAFLGRRLYDRATAWVALTIRERDQLREANVSSSRIQVIPNGIDTGIRSRVATKADVASWFRGLNPEVSWLIYLGRMDESKGLVALFESFRLLRAKLGGIQLLLVGPRDSSRSPGMAIARKGGGKGIYWLGNVTEDTKLQTLAAAELLVTPSFYGFPTTFVEAMLGLHEDAQVATEAVAERPDDGRCGSGWTLATRTCLRARRRDGADRPENLSLPIPIAKSRSYRSVLSGLFAKQGYQRKLLD